MQLTALPFLAALALSLGSSCALALGRLVDVRVIDRDTGQQLTVHRRHGRHYIAGRPGARYEVSVRNTLGERVLAVVSVDGINAVSGETAAWQQSGYVLGPWQRYEVAGWRKNLDEIAAFEFTSLSDAYATRTGRPANVGVIGVAVFRERQEPEPVWPAPRGDRLEERAGAGGPVAHDREAAARAEAQTHQARRVPLTPSARLGTGHGRREADSVGTTTFERASPQPDEIVALHYDSRENLVALGIIPRPPARPWHRADPFPESAQAGFVPDPPRR